MKEKIYNIYQSPENKKLIDFQICGITYPDKNYSIRRPSSPVACIEYIEKGNGIISADGINYEIGEGDAYFLQKGQNQFYHSDSENPWKKYFVNISGRLFDKLTEGFGLNGHIYYKRLDIKNELLKIIELSKSSASDNTEEIICLTTKIFYKMSKQLQNEKIKNKTAETMRAFLDMRVTEKFSLSELCKYMALSEAQTIRIFKKEFNTTPYSYFMSIKHSLAKNMLLNTGLSIKEIAYKLNYSDEYYFSNIFKKAEGVSPKNFRLKSVLL